MSCLVMGGNSGSNKKKKKLPSSTFLKKQAGRIITGLWMMIPVCNVHAQLHWKKMDSAFAPLPSAFHLFLCADSLDGAPFRAFYAAVKLKDKGLVFGVETANGGAITPDEYCRQQEKMPLLVVNGPFFSMESNRIHSLVVRSGKIIAHPVHALKGIDEDPLRYYYPTRSAIGIGRKRKADIAWIFSDEGVKRLYGFDHNPVIAKGNEQVPSIYDLGSVDWAWWDMKTAIGGGPTLVHESKIWITDKEEQLFSGSGDRKGPRTAMGYTLDNTLLILVIEGRSPGISEGASLEQEAKIMKSLGSYKALNMDGGGSSCMLINGKPTITPSDNGGQRKLPVVFMIKLLKIKSK